MDDSVEGQVVDRPRLALVDVGAATLRTAVLTERRALGSLHAAEPVAALLAVDVAHAACSLPLLAASSPSSRTRSPRSYSTCLASVSRRAVTSASWAASCSMCQAANTIESTCLVRRSWRAMLRSR